MNITSIYPITPSALRYDWKLLHSNQHNGVADMYARNSEQDLNVGEPGSELAKYCHALKSHWAQVLQNPYENGVIRITTRRTAASIKYV